MSGLALDAKKRFVARLICFFILIDFETKCYENIGYGKWRVGLLRHRLKNKK